MSAFALAVLSRIVSGATVQWQCDPQARRQRIYFGNHSSHLDFIAIWSALPAHVRGSVRPVAGRDYWEKDRLRRYVAGHIFRAVLIERSTTVSGARTTIARASVERMAREMGIRNSLIVFPEGTRGVNGELGLFKSGLYHLARLRPDAELIPVYLENLNRILPKGEILPVPMLSRIVFGPPLDMSVVEQKDAFLARARKALIHLKGIR